MVSCFWLFCPGKYDILNLYDNKNNRWYNMIEIMLC